MSVCTCWARGVCSLHKVTLLAGRLPLPDVMTHLAARRPVFHSEADFQFAFAQSVAALDDSFGIRLEVPQRGQRQRSYVDLVCRGGQEVSLVEFKYVTRAWTGTDGYSSEQFDLRGHEALDLARLYFIHDVIRLETWTAQKIANSGFAVLLTNDNRLWEQPASGRVTRDHDFRLHEGRRLTGSLRWGTSEAPYEANNRDLRGAYVATWHVYSQRDSGPGGNFRWLSWAATA
jgi:hypothetical protein